MPSSAVKITMPKSNVLRFLSTLIAMCLWAAEAGAAGPAVTVSPGVNPPSTSTNASGTGFGATEAVDLYFDTTDEALVVTNASGAFASKALAVPATALPGIHWITAIGRHSGLAAQVLFTVRTDWAQKGYGSQNKAFNPYENVLSPQNVAGLERVWALKGVAGPPTEYEGKLFIALSAGKIASLNPATGATLWSTTLSVPNGIALTGAGGLVFAPDSSKTVYGFSAASGAQVWSVTENQFGQVAAADGVVYANTALGITFALKQTTGYILGEGGCSGSPFGPPTIEKGFGLDNIYVACGTSVFAMNQTGGPLWSHTLSGGTLTAIAASNGRVFLGDTNGGLYWGNADTGGRFTTVLYQGAFVAAPAVARGVVYAGSQWDYLRAYEPRELQAIWSVFAGDGFSSQPAVANGVVYVGDDAGDLFAFTAANGTLLWTARGGTSNIVANGMLFATDATGDLYAYALNAGNASVYHRNPKPPAIASLHPNLSLSLYRHATFRRADEQ
jgi:outer membrane protein assembly factor BamB